MDNSFNIINNLLVGFKLEEKFVIESLDERMGPVVISEQVIRLKDC